ncbi:MAG: hypothetical protein QOF67_110 [Mycobacterium sp.]|jgi:anti-sigma regulatory factor (Ser/Thr protein kinase)|nr:hypothetical protein [Mycobacterium sp.]
MVAVAVPESAAQIRRDLSEWLRRHFALDDTKRSDVVLAVNEAMANAAEFAYVTLERPGPMHVRADYDRTAATLTVTVTDEGAWKGADPTTKGRSRGRGIPLMRVLADRTSVESSPAGTCVSLQWNRVIAQN